MIVHGAGRKGYWAHGSAPPGRLLYLPADEEPLPPGLRSGQRRAVAEGSRAGQGRRDSQASRAGPGGCGNSRPPNLTTRWRFGVRTPEAPGIGFAPTFVEIKTAPVGRLE